MSFNVRFGTAEDGENRWELRREVCRRVIREAGCHLVCLQEVLPFQLDELLDALPGYAFVARARYAGAYAPILVNARVLEAERTGDFWLSETPDVPGSRGWDAAVPRVCTWGLFRCEGAVFAVLNTHFDHQGSLARLRSAELIVRRVREFGVPVVVTGDLNCDESSEPLRVLREGGLRDSFRLVTPEGPAPTFHGFRNLKRLGKIDYVLCDASWTVHDAAVLTVSVEGRYPSDHYPVVAELEPAGPGPDPK